MSQVKTLRGYPEDSDYERTSFRENSCVYQRTLFHAQQVWLSDGRVFLSWRQSFSRRQPMPQPSLAECIAIAFAKSEWNTTDMIRTANSVFAKRQPWLFELANRTRECFFERPSVPALAQFIARDIEFRSQVKTRNLKPPKIETLLGRQSLASLDWHLPTFDTTAQLASSLGLSINTLEWLAAVKNAPGKRPEHYVNRWIKKRVSGYRLIESPKIRLKTVQRFLLQDLLNHIPMHAACHGFCAGRSVTSFVGPHVGKHFCLRMDLADFFPSVTGARVFGIFRAAGFDSDICRILTGLCTTQSDPQIFDEIHPAGHRGASELSRLYLTAHLPQGAPTSPAVANLIAYRMDCRLTALARSANAAYTRYADDLLFSGAAEFCKSAKRFATTVATVAIEEGFNINFRKTRFQRFSQRQFAAGVVINVRPNVMRREFDQLKAILHNCVKFGPDTQCRETIHFQQHLEGRVNWVSQLNPMKGAKLKRILKEIAWVR